MNQSKLIRMNEAIRSICDHLVERNAILFLGAGINAGVVNDKDESFPLGRDLGEWIARDLLLTPALQVSLEECAEMARFSLGEKALNDYLYDKLTAFKPGAAHLALVQLPWDVAYTTNYDLLAEQACIHPAITAAGTFRPIVSTATSLADFSEEDILYYKLHGTVDLANTEEGRLILTREDYRHYELNRKPLFARLKNDLLSKVFVFAGYALQDNNFRAILEDCRQEIGALSLPLSYAVKKEFSKTEEAFWRDKYNIQLVAADVVEFFTSLKNTWDTENCSVVPFLQRKSSEYLHLDETTRFQRIGDSFYLLRASDCTGPARPKLFFRGAEASWGDIRDGVPPSRELLGVLAESLFSDVLDPKSPPSVYLVTGSAGTGKTTLIRSLAYQLSNGFAVPVLFHVAGTPLDVRVLGPLIDPESPKRLIVVIHHASECVKEIGRFLEEARRTNLPLSVVLEDRKNQWLVATGGGRAQFTPAEFELGQLSTGEASAILDALQKYDALGKLTGTSREEQLQHFENLAHEDLLVALRELTIEGRFDEIIRNEFEKIPSETAKKAYVYVSAVGQLGLSLRYETLVHLLGLRYDQLD